MCKLSKCVRCGEEIQEEPCNIINKDRQRFYCNYCLAHIFHLDKKEENKKKNE